MAPLQLFALAAALVAGTSAQSSGDSSGNAKVWAAVVFINHGERTPIEGNLRSVLTPEGAQQMYRQGAAFRERYMNTSSSDANNTAFIQGLESEAIDNTQLDITSQTSEWVVAGAMAFMQGLYPPASAAFLDSAGGVDLAHNFVGSRNATDYPLDGYQYPKLRTLGYLDEQSVAIQGNARCSNWVSETRTNLRQQDSMRSLYNSTLGFYQQLFSTPPLQGTISLNDAHFWNAYEINQFVTYMYGHNQTVFENLTNTKDTLEELASNAEQLERAENSHPTSKTEDSINILYTIAGRTLAEYVAQQLISNVQWGGSRDKLTLMFGSHEPLIAFFALSGLLGRTTPTSSPFASLPKPGAAMVFELYGEDAANLDQQPAFDDLMVRFAFWPSADANETFVTGSLFGSGFDGVDVPYSTFVRVMQEYGKSASDWCEVCGAMSAPWCSNFSEAVSGDSSGSNRGSSDDSISPAVAGVIGAVMMAVMFGLIAVGLYVLGGFRLSRSSPPEENSAAAAAGGFKGPEKRDEDRDVVVTRGGAHHERVGSWEMRAEHDFPAGGGVVKDLGARDSMDDDGISVMNATPVKAHESV